MKKHFAILCYLILFGIGGNFVFGQHDSLMKQFSKNSVFVEFGGNAAGDYGITFGPSVNYDRLLYMGRIARTSFRIGCSIPIPIHNSYVLNIPVMLNLLLGKKRFFFELGGGVEYVYYHDGSGYSGKAITTVFGFRYLNLKRGILARVGLTPTIGGLGNYLYYGTIVGASIGYSF